MKINWQALSAVATFFAVLVAVLVALFREDYTTWRSHPIIQLAWFEANSPHLVWQISASAERNGFKPYTGMFLTLQLTNKGKQTASDAEALLTNVARKSEPDTWEMEKNWIPLPLQWVLGDAPERGMIPERPYRINLASFSAARIGELLVTYTKNLPTQKENFAPGEYCFEVSVFTTGPSTVKR